ncbi:MAG: DMT family transporter [Betaproteobacteria bacterium]|nr:DMT family transporter [Betaproteobacteria bacterium]
MAHISRTSLPPLGLLLVAILSLGWGVNWPVMKFVVTEIPVLHFRMICLGGGALGLFLLARLARQPLDVPTGQWPRLLVIALFNTIAWNLCTGYAITMLPAGRASILGFTMPLWSVPLSMWLLRERPSPHRLAGLAAGIAGLALLVWDEANRLQGAPLGAALMLTAAFAWAIGTLVIKLYPVELPPSSLTAWQLGLALPPIALAAFLFEPQGMPRPSVEQGIGLAYVVLVAFVLCHWAWYKLVTLVSVTVSSISSMLVPVVGVLSGMWMLGEELRWQEITALVLVLGALASVLLAPSPPPRQGS